MGYTVTKNGGPLIIGLSRCIERGPLIAPSVGPGDEFGPKVLVIQLTLPAPPVNLTALLTVGSAVGMNTFTEIDLAQRGHCFQPPGEFGVLFHCGNILNQ